MTVLRLYDPPPIESLRMRLFDVFQRLSPRTYVDQPVRIVEIDDETLRLKGQWPWPRTLLAELVQRIASGGPSVLGVDILFLEPDRLSPSRLAETLPDLSKDLRAALQSLPPNEFKLANAFRAVPTVLGLGPSLDGEKGLPSPLRLTRVHEFGENPRPRLVTYPNLLRSLSVIAAAEQGRGLLAVEPETDGVIRRVPLVVHVDGRIVPAVTLDMLRVAERASFVRVETEDATVRQIVVGRHQLPTDARGRLWVHYTAPPTGPADPQGARYISAAQLLDGGYDPAALRGALVLLGVTGLGLVDLKATPLGLMQGIDVHAQILESVLSGGFLTRPRQADASEMAIIVLAGLVVVFAVPYRRPKLAALPVVALAAALLIGAWAQYRLFGVLIDGAYPTLSSLILFSVMLGATFIAVEAARRRLAVELDRQRQIAARIEGELNAARAIQMGLLPRRFPAFPDRTDFDIHALIEPAKAVGGDLYDFMLIDADHLFFMVGDVSGKGIPAALFMAMTKELFRSNVVRRGLAIDRIVTEANAQIAIASADLLRDTSDMMFVTSFVGILNLQTGLVQFCNAGHDSPFVLADGATPRQIECRGGPPLGAKDEFLYPLESHRLRPGEMLLMFTDGVSEAQDPLGHFYSVAQVATVLAMTPPLRAAEAAVTRLYADIKTFSRGAEQADDITILALRWVGSGDDDDASRD
ncbi:MAG: CHASE2 domain-containing protein [Proteobacteria bacterium]|nr:CHASE2 domain-containing protein [Pseudomonadota bacterium]